MGYPMIRKFFATPFHYMPGMTPANFVAGQSDPIASAAAMECPVDSPLGNQGAATQRMLKEILASEEEHAEDLSSLLEGLDVLNWTADSDHRVSQDFRNAVPVTDLSGV